jgi:hypothetical protein
MKIRLANKKNRPAGYILMLVLILCAVSLLIVTGDVYRTSTVAKLNLRSNQLSVLDNAAEAATEKVYAIMAHDFAAYGPGLVSNNVASYRTNYPSASDNPYWANFNFSDAQGNANSTYVAFVTNYTGPLPTQYSNDFATTSPVYRIISNVTQSNSTENVVGTAQEDILLALLPITTYAIFYNGELEFSDCATMTIAGRTHSNSDICTGAGSGATCTFNGPVTTSSVIWSPNRGGLSYSLNQGTTYNGGKTTNLPTVQISIPMTNTHAIIDIPPAGELPTSIIGQEREYNLAQVVLVITNSATTTNVAMTLQLSYNGNVPGNDPTKTYLLVTNTSDTNLWTNAVIQLPFLSLTNTFYDQRQGQTDVVAQIDVGRYASWVTTNAVLLGKINPLNQSYPTILYVADERSIAGKMSVVRLVNAQKLPYNDDIGWTVATPNPLYVQGSYNTTLDGTHYSLGLGATTNGYTVPAALICDALTLLSSNWSDALSYGPVTGRNSPSALTLNAAIITGNIPSTGTSATTFSGGVHNLTRFLEIWTGVTVTYNTSIVCLYQSQTANAQFLMPYNAVSNPNGYYNPPTRNWGFDPTFYDPDKQPPGVPCAEIPIRFNWTLPSPGTVQ